MGKNKKRARIPKESRQNLRLWAEGNREVILGPHIEPYGEAMEQGWIEERKYLQRVLKEYHARVDWRLKDHEEPMLGEFDPEAPLPAPETLPPGEEQQKQAALAVLDVRIRAWLKYRVKRLRRYVRTKVGSTKDPWAVLLAKLSGVKSPPKARQAYQQFMHERYKDTIEPIVTKEWAQSTGNGSSVPTEKDPKADFRAEVARRLFAELPADVKLQYATRAKEEAAERRANFKKALEAQPSTSPKARQEAINHLGAFAAPILQGIHERTGLHSVLILGGPIPKYGGDLRTIHVSYGRNRSTVGAHFPQWAKDRFNGVLGLMKEYLGTAFTQQECADSALPTGLEGATYTMAPEDSDDSSDSNDSESDSDSDSEEDKPLKKKAKTGSGKAPAAGSRGKVHLKGAENAPPGNGAGVGARASTTGLKRKAPDGATLESKRKSPRVGLRASLGEASSGSPTPPVPSGAPLTSTSQVAANGSSPAATIAPVTSESQIVENGAHPVTATQSTAPLTSAAGATTASVTSASQIVGNGVHPAATAQSIAPVTSASQVVANGSSSAVTSASQIVGNGVHPAATAQSIAPVTPASQIVANGSSSAVTSASQIVGNGVGNQAPPSSTPNPSAASIAALGGAASMTSGPAADSGQPFACPEGAPKWLSDIVPQLAEVDLGPHFRSLVEALIRVEERFGFADNPRSGVSKAGRPKEVDEWIKAGRGLRAKKGWDAGIRDVNEYGTRWWAWWDLLQPAWRTRGEHGGWALEEGYDEDWTWPSLAHPGQNGCLSIVASLYFWGSAKTAAGAGAGWNAQNRESWDWAVQDVVWMMEGMERKMLRDEGVVAPREAWYV
ncbi:hypothetical protein B0H11DRAFT_1939761 [Mycena galericulata]|nr:hypothetical protein B0H11DRAFT_1939761 [Mycena galericulata]